VGAKKTTNNTCLMAVVYMKAIPSALRIGVTTNRTRKPLTRQHLVIVFFSKPIFTQKACTAVSFSPFRVGFTPSNVVALLFVPYRRASFAIGVMTVRTIFIFDKVIERLLYAARAALFHLLV
jgi:hypothetical protein